MSWGKKVFRELFSLLLIAGANLLFWMCIALVTDQQIMAPEYLYTREMNAFWVTTLLVYLLRINMGENHFPAAS